MTEPTSNATARESKEDQLAKIRREMETEDAKRAEADAEEKTAREIADLTALREARKEHGHKAVALVPTDFGGVVVKAPHPVRFKAYLDGEINYAANEDLVNHCLCHPSSSEFESMVRRQPAIVVNITDVITRLAGFRRDLLAKK